MIMKDSFHCYHQQNYNYQLQISNRIKIAVQDLGTSCIDLVKDAGNLQVNPTDGFSKRELQEHARKVTERVCLKPSLDVGSILLLY